MEISNIVCISSVEGIYQHWRFTVSDQEYSYKTHNPLTTTNKLNRRIAAFTKVERVFDDGVTIEEARLDQFLPLRKALLEEDIKKFFKIALIS